MAKIIDPDDLTWIVDGSPTTENVRLNTTAKTITLAEGGSFSFSDGVSGQCMYSLYKIMLKASSALIGAALAMPQMVFDESLPLINGWTFGDTNTLKAIRDCGVSYANTAGAFTAMFANVTLLGNIVTGTPYFVQSAATDATPTDFTHVFIGQSVGVNELIQIYSDTNGDGTPDYDYRSYLKVFLRVEGYTYDEADNTEVGYPSLTYRKYNFPITHAADANITVDDATLDGAGYSACTLTSYNSAQSRGLGANGPYNFHWIADVDGHTDKEAYSWLMRQLRKATDIDAGTPARIGKVTPLLASYVDGKLVTRYQATGDAYAGGLHMDNPNSASLNFIQEYDDTQTLRSYPYTAAITFEFDSYLAADGANGKYYIFDAATYPGPGATLLQDADSVDMTGDLPAGGSVAHTYAWATDKNWIGVAVGHENGKIATASGTIAQSVENKGVFVGGEELWFSNPA